MRSIEGGSAKDCCCVLDEVHWKAIHELPETVSLSLALAVDVVDARTHSSSFQLFCCEMAGKITVK